MDRLEAERFHQQLTNLDGEFRTYRLAMVDLLEEDYDMENEQAALDDHDNRVTDLFDHVARLTTPDEREERLKPDPWRCLQRRLQHLERNISKVAEAVPAITDEAEMDRCLLEEYDNSSKDLSSTCMTSHKPSCQWKTMSLSCWTTRPECQAIFDVYLMKIRRLLHTPVPATHRECIKSRQIEVLTINGDIMNWQMFCEQYEVSIHSRPELTDTEKLAYLWHALKDGPAQHVIKGLSGLGSEYEEAIKRLQNNYDKLRLLDLSHVKAIVEVPEPKEGSSKELRWLNNVCSQHLRALKLMGYDPSGPFVTMLIETRHNRSMILECQRHIQVTIVASRATRNHVHRRTCMLYMPISRVHNMYTRPCVSTLGSSLLDILTNLDFNS